MNTLVRNFGYNNFPTLVNGLLNNFDGEFRKNVPAINIVEGENHFRIEFFAPGLKKEDFKVLVQDKSLKVSTEKTEEKEESKEKYTHKEYSFSSFERVFRLPNTVDSDHIEASYEEGILKVSIPKKEESKPKELLVSVN